MKTKTIILGICSICLMSASAFSQEREEVEEVKSTKKEVTKEITMEDDNGVKTLTIITTDNGVKTEEVFVGEEADAKLAELMPQLEEVSEEIITEEERIEVEVDDDGNLKSVTVKTTVKGEETIEVLVGEAAQKKFDEINAQAREKAKRSSMEEEQEIDR